MRERIEAILAEHRHQSALLKRNILAQREILNQTSEIATTYKPRSSSNHSFVKCRECGVLISQCRCLDLNKAVEYSLCDSCKNG